LKKKDKILIVDDDESICKTLKLILENEGYSVEVANSGKEALDRSKTTIFNVALLDIRLPDTEGTRLLKALRETTPKMIKIMVTGYPQINNAVEALNLGADAYLIKPVYPGDLIKTIEEKLKTQKNEETMTEEKMSVFLETRTRKLLENLG
jgi:two-component system response regulator HydG